MLALLLHVFKLPTLSKKGKLTRPVRGPSATPRHKSIAFGGEGWAANVPMGAPGSGSQDGGPGLGVSEVPRCPSMEARAVGTVYLARLPSSHLSLKCSFDNSVSQSFPELVLWSGLKPCLPPHDPNLLQLLTPQYIQASRCPRRVHQRLWMLLPLVQPSQDPKRGRGPGQ